MGYTNRARQVLISELGEKYGSGVKKEELDEAGERATKQKSEVLKQSK